MSKSTISTFQLFERFPDQEAARLYLEGRLWPNGVRCPWCKGGGRITTRKDGFYSCNPCGKAKFTVRTCTIFERSHIPLHNTVVALGLFADDQAITSVRLASEIDVTQKTAWVLLSTLKEVVGEMDFTVDYVGIDRFPAYRLSSDGFVWSCAKGTKWHRLKPTPDKDGYGLVRLYGPDGWKHCRVCVLMCVGFHGPCPPGQEVRHLDGTRDNDAADNLCWGTSVENKADCERHGTKRQGYEFKGTVKKLEVGT